MHHLHVSQLYISHCRGREGGREGEREGGRERGMKGGEGGREGGGRREGGGSPATTTLHSSGFYNLQAGAIVKILYSLIYHKLAHTFQYFHSCN